MESEDVQVIARVANTLRGPLKFEDGKLSGPLISTMMMGSDEQMQVETALSSGFETGFNVQLTDNVLTLTGEQNTLAFERDISVEQLIGTHTLTEFNGEPVSVEGVSLMVLPGGEGCVSVVAQFTNSIRGELQVEENTLKGAVASTMGEVEGVMKEMEERFNAGMESGMKIFIEGKCLTLKDDNCSFVYVRSLTPGDIAGEYVLKSFNDGSVTSDGQITLSLYEGGGGSDVDVLAKVSNTLRGKAKLTEETLRGTLMSTRMMGSEAEMLVEDALTSGFEVGFHCTLDTGLLTLHCGDNTLVYIKMAAMAYENGKPTYLGEDVTPCFKDHGNGLLFRIINTVEGKWAFYNDTTKYNMRVAVTFGTRSKIESLGNTYVTVSDDGHSVAEVTVAPGTTEMFIVGHVNGYKCSYDALPI